MKYLLLTTLCVVAATSVIAAEPSFQDELIFPLQDRHVHSSSLAQCPNGDLLACWFYGSGERQSSDVLVQGARLQHGAARWSPVFVMADTPDLPDCNPVLLVDQQQELWLFWITVLAERWEDSLLRYRRASDYQDNGPPKWYWQDDILLKPGTELAAAMARGFDTIQTAGFGTDFGGYAQAPQQQLIRAVRNPSKRQRGWMTRTNALVLPSGDILLPLYSDGFYVGLMAISDDQGRTWRASAPIVGIGLNQPSVVRRRDGTLVAYLREEGELKRRVLRSVSLDDGDTWSVAVSTDIPNPNASVGVLALSDGRWVMVFNDAEQGADTLAVALSDNEGESWRWQRHLERMDGGRFHYPFIIQAQDGRIHVTYTFQPGADADKSIKHVAFDAEWIVQGD